MRVYLKVYKAPGAERRHFKWWWDIYDEGGLVNSGSEVSWSFAMKHGLFALRLAHERAPE